MTWSVEFGRRAEKQLAKLDATVRARLLRKLAQVAGTDDSHLAADPLVGDWSGFWRYRVGDYRVIVRIDDAVVTIFVIDIGHRSSVYG